MCHHCCDKTHKTEDCPNLCKLCDRIGHEEKDCPFSCRHCKSKTHTTDFCPKKYGDTNLKKKMKGSDSDDGGSKSGSDSKGSIS